VPAGILPNESKLSQLNLLVWVTPPKMTVMEEQLASKQKYTVDAAVAWE